MILIEWPGEGSLGRWPSSGVLKEAREKAQAAGTASAEALGQGRHAALAEQVDANGASEYETSSGSCPGRGEGLAASKPKGMT